MTAQATRRVLTMPEKYYKQTQSGLLVNEYEQELSVLRARLDNAKSQLAAMQAQLQHDAALPVLRNKAFVDEVNTRSAAAKATANDRRSTSAGPGCLAEVSVINLAALIERFGDRASDHALAQVAQILGGHVRDLDRVGRLGTGSFGVLLAFAESKAITKKMQKLCTKIEATKCVWEGKELPIRVSVRIASLSS